MDIHTVVYCIERLIIKRHGVPKRILTDCGLEFINREAENLRKKYGFAWDNASPEYHKTVGMVERTNKKLWMAIRKLSEFNRTSWEVQVPTSSKLLICHSTGKLVHLRLS